MSNKGGKNVGKAPTNVGKGDKNSEKCVEKRAINVEKTHQKLWKKASQMSKEIGKNK